ncbi:MAG TPA: hypothetical protein VIM70_09475 [Clostridium sp.]|uniref:hypothetical protein n=1 Tax=Clostridium sp. TaxID=1506 RepID=UPI002F92DB9C
MAITKGFKKNKLIWALIILFAALAIFSYSILYNGGVVINKTTTTEVIGKLAVIQAKGGEFELTQKNIDELSNLYFAKAITKGDITLKGVNVEILNDELLIKAPISENKINLLLTTKGKLSFSNGKVTYDADYFKIGLITLPKKFVISQISKLKNNSFSVEGNSIKINPSLFPFKISSLTIRNNKILGIALGQVMKTSFEELNKMNEAEIDIQLEILKQKLQSASVLMNTAEKAKLTEIQNIIVKAKGKSIEEKKIVIGDSITKIDKAIAEATNSDKKKELEKIRLEAEKAQKAAAEKEKIAEQQNETTRVALAKAQANLSGAYSQVQTSKGKQIISIMQSSMGKMASNPSYSSAGDQASVRSIYSTLDSASKNQFKYALAVNVDAGNLSLLRQIFGI